MVLLASSRILYDGTNDDVLEPFVIDDYCLIHLLKNTEQPAKLNVRMMMGPEEDQDSDAEMDDDDDDDSDDDNVDVDDGGEDYIKLL